jgi:hypothetical protein
MARTVESRPEILSNSLPVIEFYPQQDKVRILDVTLDILPLPDSINARRFIPPWETLRSQTCWDTPTVILIRDMAIRINGGIASRNEGPTGVSKSYAVEVLCAMTNRPYIRHNYSKEADIGDTIGRFVPADSKLAVRFEELLADKNLPNESRETIERARRESRSLTLYESKKIAKAIGISSLLDDKHWKWQNGTLTGAMEYGSIFGADEPNLAPGNILERENSALENYASLRLVEHEGEVIRKLTAEEKAIIDKGGLVPGVIGLDTKYRYIAAQNPYGIGGGRYQESEARRNRLQDRIVEALTPKEYKEFLNFLIHGDQPNIVWHNKTYKGERGVRTFYRDLEAIPNVDFFVEWLAKFQDDLQQLTKKDKIGSEKDIRGGSYVFTRRNILRCLDSIKGAQGALLDVDETIKQNKPVYNQNWHDLVMEGIYQEYIAGVNSDDRQVVDNIIHAGGIEDALGISKNNPKPPLWVLDAQKKGLNVTKDNKGYRIS